MRIQNALPDQSSKLTKFGAARPAGILLSVCAKGAESGGKGRQIRRLFHPDVQILPHSASPVSKHAPVTSDERTAKQQLQHASGIRKLKARRQFNIWRTVI